MATVRKNISISVLAQARLTAEAKRKGTSDSGIISQLIMQHLPATRLDLEAEVLLDEGLAKMPAGWGEPPAWKTANREDAK